jgi:hypothetical protein
VIKRKKTKISRLSYYQSQSESNVYLVCKTIEEIHNDIEREKYFGHAK